MLRLVVLLLASCAPPEPTKMCDYCKVPRREVEVRLYQCQKCQGTHWSCPKESPLHAVDYGKTLKGGSVGRSTKACP